MEFSFDFWKQICFDNFYQHRKSYFKCSFSDGIQLWFLNTNLFWCWFFSDAYVSFFFWFWGAHFFQGFFNATWISPLLMGFFVGNFVTNRPLFHYFSSLFFSFGCSCWVSTMICLSGCWREMKELVHNLLLSQNLDTSPEARTVWSKFSILFEVFWLISIHKWTKVPNRFWLRFWRLIGWFFLPKWQKNVNYKIINHK